MSWVVESLEARALLSSTPAMVADINPGATTSNASNLVAIGSTTYFAADDGVHGQELWKSDGTSAGTGIVKNINPGDVSSNPRGLINVNGTLFFTANDGVHGRELWKSDGTVAGTTLVKDIDVIPNSRTNGTYPSAFWDLTNVNGTLFFFADDGNGPGLWKSDGSAAGTVQVGGLEGNELTNVNGTLFSAVDDGYSGVVFGSLWKSDGTQAGTTLVKDIAPRDFDYYSGVSSSSSLADLTNVNGTLFFTADDGTAGRELWKSDGTAAGTTMVVDIFPGGSNDYYGGYHPFSSGAANLTNVNGTLFFTADDGVHGYELWKSDGTEAGTEMVKDIKPGPIFFTNVNETLFFEADDGAHGFELWMSDGTAAGTMMVADINPGSTSSSASNLMNANGTLFFTADDGVHGNELWQSDGTAAGTMMVADINPGSTSSSPSNLMNANGTLFFTADDGVHGSELWTFPGISSTPPASLDLNGLPTTTTAGATGSLTVTARNADGTTNAGYTGTIQFSTTDLQTTIINPATGSAVTLQGFTYTFSAADAGVHTFSATLRTAGTQSVTATDTQTSTIAGTEGSILVKPAAASTMAVTGFPSTTTAGVVHNFSVTLKDSYGNVAAGYTGTVHLTSSDSKATLPANYTFTAADAGSHTFSATLKTAGKQSITAADTLISALKATEGGITVNAAAASKFIITAPTSVKIGIAFSLTLTVQDTYGNVVIGYTGTVRFTSTDNTATLPANYTFTAADQGVRTFTGLVLRNRGKQTIAIADTLNGGLTATEIEKVT